MNFPLKPFNFNDPLVVDNLTITGDEEKIEVQDAILKSRTFFQAMVAIRGAEDAQEFLRKKGKIALVGGIVLNTEGVLIKERRKD